jgi:hypothetical protein
MEARFNRAALVAVVLLVSMGAKYRSANFVIDTPDPRLAPQFAEAAEGYRKTLALSWLGEELPNWSRPCPVTIKVGANLGAGGATTFTFDRGEVFGWSMSIQGSAQRVLDSVLPHEITHMIFASHFRRPLPRWADEGGATSVEHMSERNKQRQMLDQFLRNGRGIAFNKMFAMTEYPSDILPLYAQGYSTAEFLIQSGGRRRYIKFLDEGLQGGNWAAALQKNYGLGSLGELQQTWLAWVKQGSPLKAQAPAPAAASPDRLAAAGQPSLSYPNVLPRKPLTLVGSGPAAGVPAPNHVIAVATIAARPDLDFPYTPGSTIAVSKLSIPSTGWRSGDINSPPNSALASSDRASNIAADRYGATASPRQQMDAPTRTTMWR